MTKAQIEATLRALEQYVDTLGCDARLYDATTADAVNVEIDAAVEAIAVLTARLADYE